MANIRESIHALATMLEYPQGDIRPMAADLCQIFAGAPAHAREHLDNFREALRFTNETGQEELYTRTFDINPQCSLEVGWQIYGESYDRGAFLVKMKAALNEQGIAPTTELPDHLPQMLRLFARVDPQRMRDLAVGFLEPGITKMISGFANSKSPYLHLLKAANAVIIEIASKIDVEECHV